MLPDHLRRGRSGGRIHDRHDPERLSGGILARARGRIQFGVQRTGYRLRNAPGFRPAQMASGRRPGPRCRRPLRLWRGSPGVLHFRSCFPLRPQGRSAGVHRQASEVGRTRGGGVPPGQEPAHPPGLYDRDDVTGRHGRGRIIHNAVGHDGLQGSRWRSRGRAIPVVCSLCGHAGLRGGLVVHLRIHTRPDQPGCRGGLFARAFGRRLRCALLRGIAARPAHAAPVRLIGRGDGRRHHEQHGAGRSGGAAT